MIINPLQKSISRVFPNKTAALMAEALFLLLLGMVAILIHSKLRMPMHLPGKQGILFIALVVSGRGLSRFPFAAGLTCTGSAILLMTPVMGFQGPHMAFTYIIMGAIMDFIYGISSRYSEKPWVLALASGVAWMFIPLIRLFMSLFVVVPLNLFSTGYAFPFLTHLLFGFTGGLIGAGILSLATMRKN